MSFNRCKRIKFPPDKNKFPEFSTRPAGRPEPWTPLSPHRQVQLFVFAQHNDTRTHPFLKRSDSIPGASNKLGDYLVRV